MLSGSSRGSPEGGRDERSRDKDLAPERGTPLAVSSSQLRILRTIVPLSGLQATTREELSAARLVSRFRSSQAPLPRHHANFAALGKRAGGLKDHALPIEQLEISHEADGF